MYQSPESDPANRFVEKPSDPVNGVRKLNLSFSLKREITAKFHVPNFRLVPG